MQRESVPTRSLKNGNNLRYRRSILRLKRVFFLKGDARHGCEIAIRKQITEPAEEFVKILFTIAAIDCRKLNRKQQMTARLRSADVANLLEAAPSPERAASRLGQSLAKASLSDGERLIAEELLRQLLDEAASKVREIIAETLKDSPHLPHDVAVRLINDIDSVAIPVLKCSTVLTDDDLIAVVHAGQPSKQVAIASRDMLGASVVEELLSTDNGHAVSALMHNPAVHLDEAALEFVAARFAGDREVVALLKRHPALSAHLAERMRRFSAATLIEYLKRYPNLPEEVVIPLILRTREETFGVLDPDRGTGQDATDIVNHLAEHTGISASFVVRALGTGDIELFETALARRARIPVSNARTLIYDPGPLGLKSVWDRAKLPADTMSVIRSALDVLQDMFREGYPFDITRFQTTLAERILTQDVSLERADLDFLLMRVQR
jgi:uncharacterized protein (DUF2336 family)